MIEWKSVERGEGRERISTNVTFSIEVVEDELDGGFVASCIDLPGCYSQGETEEEAVSNLVEAISGVMEARMQRHLRRQPLHGPGEGSASVHQPHRHTLELPVA